MQTPPRVSIPKDNGVTSRRTTFLSLPNSPARTPPWIAAPTETHSSGLIPFEGSLPRISRIAFWTAGIREEPPTRIILSMSFPSSPASFIAKRVGPIVRSTRSRVSSSNFARVKVKSKCFGPLASAVINGRLMFVCVIELNSIFAFSAASIKRCALILSAERSIPLSRLNSSTIQSIIFLSKSSPPRWVSPFVAWTSKVPSEISRIETSNVPPPKSKTRTVSSVSLSKP